MLYSVEPSDSERQGTAVVVPETADAALLAQPLRCLADVEAIERTPLDRRLGVVDISQRIALGLAAHDPCDTAIFYVSDGDVDRPPVKVPFSELRGNIDNTGALLRVSGIGRGDVVAVLLPTVPAIYWSILGAMTAGIAFPINWMLEPRHVLHLLKEAKAKAVIALGPTPGFKIWESLMSIAGELPHGTAIWSVAGPDGDVLPDTDLDAHIANVAGQSGPPSERAGDDVAIRHQPLPRLRVRNLAIFGGILQIWAGLRVRKLATEAPLRLPVSEGGFWCLVERFVFKADLANCQPATAPLELKNNKTMRSGKGNVLRIMTTTTATPSRSSSRAGAATSSLAASAKFKSFAIAFGISVPIVYFGCEMFNLPAFTYHPATNRVGLGWEAARSGEGPAMYWYGWTGVTLVAGFILGLLATLLPEGVVKKIPLALLWLLPILALVPLAYSLMPFWTK